jgi:hypothetical protein
VCYHCDCSTPVGVTVLFLCGGRRPSLPCSMDIPVSGSCAAFFIRPSFPQIEVKIRSPASVSTSNFSNILRSIHSALTPIIWRLVLPNSFSSCRQSKRPSSSLPCYRFACSRRCKLSLPIFCSIWQLAEVLVCLGSPCSDLFIQSIKPSMPCFPEFNLRYQMASHHLPYQAGISNRRGLHISKSIVRSSSPWSTSAAHI